MTAAAALPCGLPAGLLAQLPAAGYSRACRAPSSVRTSRRPAAYTGSVLMAAGSCRRQRSEPSARFTPYSQPDLSPKATRSPTTTGEATMPSRAVKVQRSSPVRASPAYRLPSRSPT